MAWLCFSAQRAIATGELQFATKAVSTSGCSYHFMADEAMSMLAVNETAPEMIAMEIEPPGFQIYHISYLWYTLVGSSICIIVSLIASYVIGPNKPCELNPNLLAPFVRKLITTRSPETTTNKVENVIEISFELKRKDESSGGSFWSSFHGFNSIAGICVCSRLNISQEAHLHATSEFIVCECIFSASEHHNVIITRI